MGKSIVYSIPSYHILPTVFCLSRERANLHMHMHMHMSWASCALFKHQNLRLCKEIRLRLPKSEQTCEEEFLHKGAIKELNIATGETSQTMAYFHLF